MPWGVSQTCPSTSTARWWPGIINCHNHKRLSRDEKRHAFNLSSDEERRAFNLSRDEERLAFNLSRD